MKIKVLPAVVILTGVFGCATFTTGPTSSGTKEERGFVEAAKNGELAIVQQLLGQGVNINVDYGAGSALMVAAYNGHLEVVQFLVDQGSDVFQKDTANGWTALDLANIAIIRKESHDMIIELLKQKMGQ